MKKLIIMSFILSTNLVLAGQIKLASCQGDLNNESDPSDTGVIELVVNNNVVSVKARSSKTLNDFSEKYHVIGSASNGRFRNLYAQKNGEDVFNDSVSLIRMGDYSEVEHRNVKGGPLRININGVDYFGTLECSVLK